MKSYHSRLFWGHGHSAVLSNHAPQTKYVPMLWPRWWGPLLLDDALPLMWAVISYMAKLKGFCRCSSGPQSADVSVSRETVLGGPDLIRWALPRGLRLTVGLEEVSACVVKRPRWLRPEGASRWELPCGCQRHEKSATSIVRPQETAFFQQPELGERSRLRVVPPPQWHLNFGLVSLSDEPGWAVPGLLKFGSEIVNEVL